MDDYLTPALGYVSGSLAGLALILARIDANGVDAVAWGMALNAAIATVVPAVALGLRARTERMPAGAIRPRRGGTRRRLRELLAGAALPFALQAIYLVCLPIAARGGVGDVTSLGYAYLIGAAIVAVAASSLGLVTSVPLTRSGIDGRRVATHVDASSWLALLAIGATAGIFAVAGSSILAHGARQLLRHRGRRGDRPARRRARALDGDVGRRLRDVPARLRRGPRRRDCRRSRSRRSLLHLPLAFAGQALAGLWGLAAALALSTALAFGWMLVLLDALAATLGELAVAAGTVAALVVAAFGLAALLLDDGVAALAGTAIFVVAVAVLRPPGTALVVDVPPRARMSASRGRGRPQLERPRADAALPRLARRGDVSGRSG